MFGGTVWTVDAMGACCADLSRKAVELMDRMKDEVSLLTKKQSHTFGGSITNVAFEFGYALEKGQQDASALIPLLFKGDFTSSFPPNILKETLIRDMRKEANHISILVGLANPIGIIPAMCPQLIGNAEYKRLLAVLNGQEPDSEQPQLTSELVKTEVPNQSVVLDVSITHAESRSMAFAKPIRAVLKEKWLRRVGGGGKVGADQKVSGQIFST